MSAIDTTPTEEIDEAALAEHLATEFGDADEYAIEPLTGGSSNDTLLVRWGDREFAMRYPPAGRPVPGLLHDVMVEHEALSALSDTWVPTPDPVLACREDSVIGKPFYLMELVEGDVLGGEELERLAAPEHRRAAGWEVIDVLAGLHDLDHTRLDVETEAVEADLDGAIEAHTDRHADVPFPAPSRSVTGSPTTFRSRPTWRSSTATTNRTTSCSRPGRRRGCRRCSTGRCSVSATR
jgi:aminoglycoside phosphotransferase (APT) family kinase protein